MELAWIHNAAKKESKTGTFFSTNFSSLSSHFFFYYPLLLCSILSSFNNFAVLLSHLSVAWACSFKFTYLVMWICILEGEWLECELRRQSCNLFFFFFNSPSHLIYSTAWCESMELMSLSQSRNREWDALLTYCITWQRCRRWLSRLAKFWAWLNMKFELDS